MTAFEIYKIAQDPLLRASHRYYNRSVRQSDVSFGLNFIVNFDYSSSAIETEITCLWVDDTREIMCDKNIVDRPFVLIGRASTLQENSVWAGYRLWNMYSTFFDAMDVEEKIITAINQIRMGIQLRTPYEQTLHNKTRKRSKKLAKDPRNYDRFAILKRDDYRCQLCGRDASDNIKLEIDHKHPVSKGGSNELENLWTLCKPCNRSKGTKLL